MTDILGPASALNAVTARPSDGRQYGAVDTFFMDCSSPSTQDGTQVSAAWLNQITGVLRTLARANGLKLDGVTPVVLYDQSDNMVLNGIGQLVQRGQLNFATDKGTADAMVAMPAVAVAEYLPGMRFLVLKNPGVGANATATPTINFGLGNLTITKDDASPIAAGDLKKAGIFEVECDGAGNARLTSLLTISDVIALIQTGSFAVASGTNAYTATLKPAPSSIPIGMEILILFGNANSSTAPTLNLNGFGAATVIKDNGGALVAGDLTNFVSLVWDGTYWRLIGLAPSDVIAGTFFYGVDTSGAANTVTANIAAFLPGGAATGRPFEVKIANTNTGASTISINGAGAVPIKLQGGAPLVGGEMIAGDVVPFIFDGTNVQIYRSATLKFSPVQRFTPGSYTETVPFGATGADIELWGGGAGGGGVGSANNGSGGGGGGGGYGRKSVTGLVAGQTIAGIVGAGGAPGGNGGAGGAGGTTSVGSFCTATGGLGGSANGGGTGGAGGYATNCDVAIYGGPGSAGFSASQIGPGGAGGGAPLGGQGGGSGPGLAAGGTSPGGGGGGSGPSGANPGGAGAPGGYRITWK